MAPMLAADRPATRRRRHFWLRGWPVFVITGADAEDLLSRLSTNALSPLRDGQPVTTLFLSPAGRLLHRVLLLPQDRGLLALAEPGAVGAFPAWLDRYTFAEDIRVEDAPGLAALRVVLEEKEPSDLAGLSRWPRVMSARRSFGAEPSLILVAAPADLAEIASRGLVGDELDERASLQLRVECGEPAAGSEITEDRFPLEAGLLAEISFTKGCYTGQEVVARQDAYGKVARRLVRVTFEACPVVGDAIESQGREAGAITSVAPRPIDINGAPRFLALAFVPTKLSAPGSAVTFASGLEGRVIG